MNAFTIEIIDCPICMECISDIKNRVTTECGHCFHTNCLMTSVAHNGFGCPYCRSTMAEEIKDNDSESEWGSYDNEEEDEDNDYALRGFRFMFNRLTGEIDDHEDILEENEDNENNEEEIDEPKPSAEYITQKLTEQEVTMEKLVKCLLLHHEEYYNEDSFDRIDGEIFGKLRIIISNYRPAQVQPASDSLAPQASEPQQDCAQVESPVSIPHIIDYNAQPKNSRNVTTRRIMYHV